MNKKYKFRLGKDPLGNLSAEEVDERIRKLFYEYPQHIIAQTRLAPSHVRVWVVALDLNGIRYFAPAKIVGYSDSVEGHIEALDSGQPMTGIDAITALEKRGYLDFQAEEYPEIENELLFWMMDSMQKAPRSKHRFMIHQHHIVGMSDCLTDIQDTYDLLSDYEKSVFHKINANNGWEQPLFPIE